MPIGLFDKIRERNAELRGLREQNPAEFAQRITSSFDKAISSFGSREARLAALPKPGKSTASQFSDKLKQTTQSKQQLAAVHTQTDSIELGNSKIRGALGDVVKELRVGFKDLRQAILFGNTGGLLDLVPSLLGNKKPGGFGRGVESSVRRGATRGLKLPSALSKGAVGALAAPSSAGFLSRTAAALESSGGSLSGLPSALRSAGTKTSAVIGSIKNAMPEGLAKAATSVGEAGSSALKSAKNVLGSVKGVSSLGGILTLGTAAYDEYKLLSDDTKSAKEKAIGTAAIGGGAVGAIGGAELGAAIGTAMLPGIGTLVGGVAGGIGGYLAGSNLAESAATFLSKSIENTAVGDIIGRGAALVMTPFSADARAAVVNDYETRIIPALSSTFGPVITAVGSLSSSVSKVLDSFWQGTKETAQNLSDAGTQLMGGIRGAASAMWGGAKSAVSQVVSGNFKGATSSIFSAGKQAYGELKAGATSASGLARGRYNTEETNAISSLTSRGETFRGGKGLTSSTKDLITNTATKYGVDPKAMLTMAQIESGGNANAVSATGAAGLYQFTSGTAKQYGVKNRFDEAQNTEGAAKLMRDNSAALKKAGLEASTENLYLAHQQGAGGAVEILKAAQGKGTLSEATKTNMGLNFGNMSASEYVEANRKKVASAAKVAESVTLAGNYLKPTSSITPSSTSVPVASANPSSITPSATSVPVASANLSSITIPKTSASATLVDSRKVSKAPSSVNTLKVSKAPSSVDTVGTSSQSDFRAVSSITPSNIDTPTVTTTSLKNIGRVASGSVPAVSLVKAQTKEESRPVSITNPQAIAPQTSTSVTQATGAPRTSPSNVPDLAEIPPFFPDLALAGIMLGRV